MHHLDVDSLRRLLQDGAPDAIRARLAEAHPHTAAEALQLLSDEEVWSTLRHARKTDAAAAFCHLPLTRQVQLASGPNTREIAALLEVMAADDRTDLIKNLDPATASAPLITSIADIGGVLIYFSIATWWLGDVIRAAAEASGG